MANGRLLVFVDSQDYLGRPSSEGVLAVGMRYEWQQPDQQGTLDLSVQTEGENHEHPLLEQAAWYGRYLSELVAWKVEL